ncbi:hypothetical protein IFT92_09660 [Peribacillus simplex]|uniref:hypothetical protein n=1 Tax=Peribacillus TaxID=2675229 RepID=UPI001920425C|nr:MULTISPECIES: hypothetical protein [Peribacillus]MBD8588077.1 hypothetical protein [Peribacillus simplex]MEA3575381.1 hypothetical protein [Peribacillus frigoritolerans]
MFTFKKITVGFLVIWSLAACDNEQEMVIKPERVDVQEENEVQKQTTSFPVSCSTMRH